MSDNNSNFYQLLQALSNEQTFDLQLSNGNMIVCKQLSTGQLKELIKTIVDSPITQIEFNRTATKIFIESAQFPENYTPNIIDRLLFLIETRIQSISSKATINNEGKLVTVDFEQIKQNLKQQIAENKTLFEPGQSIQGNVGLTFGSPTLRVEEQLNEEIYSSMVVNSDDPEDLRKLIGNVFMYEIAKFLKTIKIQDQTLDLSALSFQERLQAVENLPASAIQNAIEYIEKQKAAIDQCLMVDGFAVQVDGSLFSFR